MKSAGQTIAQKAKDLSDLLIQVLKSSGETWATRSFVVQQDGVVYTATLKLEVKKVD